MPTSSTAGIPGVQSIDMSRLEAICQEWD